jgi:putative MATE family efflux protein
MIRGKQQRMDMCNGPLFSKIVFFTIPLMMTFVLQLLFHAADLIVVGRFATGEALAAVGATNGLTTLVLNVFFGLSTGINVVVSRNTGAKNHLGVARAVHTAAAIALRGGFVMAVIGILISRPALQWMETPPQVLDKAVLYMRIFCAGIPFIVFFHFGSAILRAVGDTKRPLIFMLAAGIVNVLLNLFFVLVCRMDVGGVAIATMIANALSAFLVLVTLRRSRDAIHFSRKMIRIDRPSLGQIFHLGLPGGIQGACFSISNIVIQSSVNSFGWQAVAGNTAAMSLEGLIYVASSAFFHTAISFTGQNLGAKKYDRIKTGFRYCLVCATVAALVTGYIFLFFGRELLGIYNTDPEVIRWGLLRMKILFTTWFLCGVMDVISGTLRGLGHSIKPMFVILIGVCGSRIFWVFFVFPRFRSMESLLISYPLSWLGVSIVNGLLLYYLLSKLPASRKA